MNFYEDNISSIGFNRDLDASYMIFKENVTSDQFIDVHKKVVDMLNTMDTCSGKHLVDTQVLKTVSLEGQKWVAENVVPVMHEKGNCGKAKIALVMSGDVFGQFAVKNITKKTDEISEVHFFNTRDEAENWLKSLS